jgi:predicted GNAT family acetyltransferase
MDAKEKAFRDAAKAEGYSDEDINAHLAKSSAKPQTPTVEAPTPVAEGPSPGFGANVEAKATQERQRLAADKKIREDAFAIPDWMLPAAAAGAGGAALAGGKAVYKSLSDKMADVPPVRTEPVFGDVPARVPGEPTLDVQALAPQPATPAQPTSVPKPTIADLQQKLGVVPGAAAPAVVPTPVALPATPVAEVPVSPIETPTSTVMETPETPVAKAAALVEGKAPVQFNIESRDASETFGQGAERIRYSDQKSGGSIDVLKRPDGSASVMSLEVPEAFRGQGIGESLQSKVLQDFPEMQGQVSSKAAATTAYRLGRRPPNQPNATLEDVFKLMDENSSVNLVSPKMQQTFSSIPTAVPPPEVTPGAAAILETQTPAAIAVTAKQEKKIKGAIAPTGPIQTVKTGSGLDAYLGQGAAKERIPSAFKTAAEIPAGYAFVPGADIGGMNTARNRLGQEGYTEFVKAQGTPFGTYDETQKVLKSLDENRIGPILTREQRKTIGAPMLPTTTGLGGKAIKVGGVAGALLAVADLASAQSLPEAAAIGGNIAVGALPLPLQALTYMKGAGEGEDAAMAYLRRMQEAKARGAGNRGMAYDPRKPYNPQFMDVGIPPPFNR